MNVGNKYGSLAVAFAIAISVSSLAWLSTASQSFTMKMEDSTRKAWDKSFNKLVNEPFATKLSCVEKSRQTLTQGRGCIDMSETEQMCCNSWKIHLACQGGQWKQTTIDADNCSRRKTAPPSPPPTASGQAHRKERR